MDFGKFSLILKSTLLSKKSFFDPDFFLPVTLLFIRNHNDKSMGFVEPIVKSCSTIV